MAVEALFPGSAAEAVQLFGDGKDVTVFAGGTILMPAIVAGRLEPTRALMLHRSGLDEIRSDGNVVRIGAMVPVAAIADGEDGLLARFAQRVADVEVRAAATIGGNLCAPAGYEAQRGDLGAPLIALGARVRSDGKGGERTEPVEDFLAGDRSGRLVLEIEVDRPSGAWFPGHGFQHGAPLPQAEERAFLGVAQDGHNQLVKNIASPLDQVEVSIGGRIERAGVDGDNLLQISSQKSLGLV